MVIDELLRRVDLSQSTCLSIVAKVNIYGLAFPEHTIDELRSDLKAVIGAATMRRTSTKPAVGSSGENPALAVTEEAWVREYCETLESACGVVPMHGPTKDLLLKRLLAVSLTLMCLLNELGGSVQCYESSAAWVKMLG